MSRVSLRDDLQSGPHRDFVLAIRVYYDAASHPSARDVSSKINKYDGESISYQTVYSTLSGGTFPKWHNVALIVRALLEMAAVDNQVNLKSVLVEIHEPWLKASEAQAARRRAARAERTEPAPSDESQRAAVDGENEAISTPGLILQDGQPRLEVARAKRIQGAAVPLSVWVDSHLVADLDPGESIVLSVASGIHLVRCQLRDGRSDPGGQEVEASAGDHIVVTVATSRWNGLPQFRTRVARLTYLPPGPVIR